MTTLSKFNALLEPIASREMQVQELEDDNLFGMFPARVTIHNGNGPLEVIAESLTLSDIVKEYETASVSRPGLRALYVQTGIVQAALRASFDPMEIEHLQTIHATLSSPDSISRQVYEDENLTEVQRNTLLLSLREGWVTTDLASINAGRLAMTIAYGNSVLDGQELPDWYLLHRDMMTHLRDTLDQQQVYTELFTSFGGSLETATSQFANTIPRLEIMGAFPMSENEAEQLIDLVHTP